MAVATEMTLTLGRTVYSGDPSEEVGSDERIEGRELRVSVTWKLTDYEQNLPQMASALAAEAGRALEEADRTVRKDPGTETNGVRPNRVGMEVERFPAHGSPSLNGGVPPADENSASIQGPKGYSSGRSGLPAGNGQHGRASAGGYSSPYVPGMTKPQQLAIQSHCTRHNVADWELRRLVWERFAKKELRELNKEQAGELLAALEEGALKTRSDKEQTDKESSDHEGADNRQWPGNPAYAN